MDLGDEGAARAIDLLGPQDAIAVFAVDTEPHAIVPLTRLGGDRAGLTDTVRRITSGGGGIYIYNRIEGRLGGVAKGGGRPAAPAPVRGRGGFRRNLAITRR